MNSNSSASALAGTSWSVTSRYVAFFFLSNGSSFGMAAAYFSAVVLPFEVMEPLTLPASPNAATATARETSRARHVREIFIENLLQADGGRLHQSAVAQLAFDE